MTTRRLLLIVAGLGVLIGGVIAERRRRGAYTERLNYHRQQMEGASGPYTMFHQIPKADQEHLIRAWIHHARMWQKYQEALSIPFHYVAHDPPEPE